MKESKEPEDSKGSEILDGLSKGDLEIIRDDLGWGSIDDLMENADDYVSDIENCMKRLGIRGSAFSSAGASSGGKSSFSSAESFYSPDSASYGGSASSASYGGSAAGSVEGVMDTPEVIRRFRKLASTLSVGRGRSPADLELEGRLPPVLFASLAELVSDYSSHLGQKTVSFAKGKLSINQGAASTDRAKDSEDDASLVKSNTVLRREILDQAKLYGGEEDSETFLILAALFNKLNNLRPDLCNQQNAQELAKFLNKYAPKPGDCDLGVPRSVGAGHRYETPPPGKRSEHRHR